jgi:uncharacterized protein (TIGR03083 family)
MTLSRSVAVPGMTAEYEAFGELIQGLSAERWAAPTRCSGWTVADVAAHVVGQLTDVVQLRLDGLGSPEVTARQVSERRGRTPAELADELRGNAKAGADMAASFDAAWDGPVPGGGPGTIGAGIEALWFDTYVHADDIRQAIGLPTVPGAGLLAAGSHLADLLTEQGWGPAELRLGAVGTFPVSGGGGRVVEADPHQFVLAATGRTDPASLGLDETVNVYRA